MISLDGIFAYIKFRGDIDGLARSGMPQFENEFSEILKLAQMSEIITKKYASKDFEDKFQDLLSRYPTEIILALKELFNKELEWKPQ